MLKRYLISKLTRIALFSGMTACVVLVVEWGRRTGTLMPIPFLLLYVSVVVSGGMGGRLVGGISGTLAALFVIYSGTVGFGPPTLTGGTIQIILGVALYSVTGILLGHFSDHRNKIFEEMRGYEAKLEAEVLARTNEVSESEKRFRTVLDNLPIGVNMKDLEGHFLLVNKQLATWYGVAEKDLLGKTTAEALGEPETVQTTRLTQERKLLETGATVTREEEKHRANGLRQFVVINKFPVLDAQGNQIGFGTASTDITDRKKAEELLKESKERYAFAIAGTNDGLWDWNIETNENYMSPRFKEILGYQDNELENDVEVFFNALHPDDFERINEEVREHFEKHVPYNTDYRLRHKDGSYIWIHAKGQAVWDDDGKPLRMAGSISDITDRKQAEEALKMSEARLAGILDIEPEAVIAIGAKMNIRLFNQSAERIFGYDADKVLGRSLEMLMPERFRKGHRKHVEEFDRSEDTYRLMDERQEIAGLRKDGTEFPASASVSKLEIGGEIINTVLLQDITKRKEAEKALIDAKNEAEKANHTKSHFLAAVSHELRTPLNAILGLAQILEGQYFGPLGDKKYQEYAEDICSSGEYLLALIDDLLDISMIEAGKQALEKEKLSIGKVVADSVKLVDQKALNGGINLMANVPENLPPLYADLRATRQILLNLLSNAIKFTPKGGKITVSAKALKKNTTIKVADTGRGISAEILPGLTDMFVRSEKDPYVAEKGWGLGLSITKSLVDLHNGKLDIKSKVGKGTTVTVTLPNGTP